MHGVLKSCFADFRTYRDIDVLLRHFVNRHRPFETRTKLCRLLFLFLFVFFPRILVFAIGMGLHFIVFPVGTEAECTYIFLAKVGYGNAVLPRTVTRFLLARSKFPFDEQFAILACPSHASHKTAWCVADVVDAASFTYS